MTINESPHANIEGTWVPPAEEPDPGPSPECAALLNELARLSLVAKPASLTAFADWLDPKIRDFMSRPGASEMDDETQTELFDLLHNAPSGFGVATAIPCALVFLCSSSTDENRETNVQAFCREAIAVFTN